MNELPIHLKNILFAYSESKLIPNGSLKMS